MKLGNGKLGEKLGDVQNVLISALKTEIQKRVLLVEAQGPPEHINHFLEQAGLDLDRAENSLEEGDFKWSIVQSYYSMFNAARAILFKLGFRDKKHYVITSVLEELSKLGKLESKYTDDFQAAMKSREDANYRATYSEGTANFVLEIAKEFLNRMKKLAEVL